MILYILEYVVYGLRPMELYLFLEISLMETKQHESKT